MEAELERLRKANKDLAMCLEQMKWAFKTIHVEFKFSSDRTLSQLERAAAFAERVLVEHFPPDGEP